MVGCGALLEPWSLGTVVNERLRGSDPCGVPTGGGPSARLDMTTRHSLSQTSKAPRFSIGGLRIVTGRSLYGRGRLPGDPTTSSTSLKRARRCHVAKPVENAASVCRTPLGRRAVGKRRTTGGSVCATKRPWRGRWRQMSTGRPLSRESDSTTLLVNKSRRPARPSSLAVSIRSARTLLAKPWFATPGDRWAAWH